MSMAAPVLSLAVSPDDQTMAVGMGQLLAVHRREQEIKLRNDVVSSTSKFL